MTNDKCSGFSLIEVLVAISLIALLAVYLGAGAGELVTEDKFYKTCYMMEDIKEAIIGKPGLYCNGVQQFTGYVSDMGNLPNLYYFDKKEKLLKKVTCIESGRIEAIEGADGFAEALRQGCKPQPKALWIRPETMPEWKYHEDGHLWAGWRGPYIDPPPGGALRDAWGNEFLFVIGEVLGHVGADEENTYRCKQSYVSTRDQLRRPGEQDSTNYWEEIKIPIPFGQEKRAMNFRIWQDLGTAKDPDGNEVENISEGLQTKQEKFYGHSCLTIISLGKNGEPGGDGLDKDISIVIEPAEYSGEVAGHVGNRQELFVHNVCLYYPNYTEDGGRIEELCIPQIQDNSQLVEGTDDCYTGINFRYGTSTAHESITRYKCEGGTGKYCDPYAGDCTCTMWPNDTSRCAVDWQCWVRRPDMAGCCFHYYWSEDDEGWDCWRGIADLRCHTCLEEKDHSCSDFSDWMGDDYDNCICEPACVRALCSRKVGSYDCECDEFEKYCSEWKCDEDIGDGVDGCQCTPYFVSVEYDDPNWMETDIPIGIRSIQGDGSSYYMFSVSAGGNWIGTVRGE